MSLVACSSEALSVKISVLHLMGMFRTLRTLTLLHRALVKSRLLQSAFIGTCMVVLEKCVI